MSNLFEMLEREWEQLGRSRQAARRLGDVCREADGATSLAGVERWVRQAAPADADRVLVALARRVVDDGDELAARVLLQLLLPGTRRLARQWWALGDHEERAAAAVAAVYRRIRSYPLARRPGRVAANVLLDAARELRRAVAGGAAVTVCADPLEAAGAQGRAAGDDDPHPAVELARLLRDALRDGIIDATQAELIARSRIAGHPLSEMATERGMPRRTLFHHRQRAERALGAGYRAAS